MRLKNVLLTVFFALPMYLAASIAGVYEVSGENEAGVPYSGIVHINKQDSIYTILWTFDDGLIDIGTGVKLGNNLSFVFYETNRNTNGTQLYEIKGNYLEGPWVRLGALKNGYEKLKKIRCASDFQ